MGTPGPIAFEAVAEFGPESYTIRPVVTEILDPLAGAASGGMRRWQGLGADDGGRLLEEVPPEVRDGQQNPGAPSMANAVRLIERHGGTLSGYWVLPPRFDERITIDGMTVPAAAADEIDPDRWADERRNVGNGMVHLWWD